MSYKKKKLLQRSAALVRGISLRTRRRMAMGTKNPNRSYSYKFKVNKGTVGVGSALQANYNAINFQLNDITSAAELTSLYDEYCITKIVCEFIPRAGALSDTIAGAYGNVDQQYGAVQPFMTVIDYDDSNAPANRTELLQYQTAKYTKPTAKHVRVLSPKIAVQTYKIPVSSGYSAKSRQWIDCADNTVPHYGIKWAWDQSVPAPQGGVVVMDIYCTYYVKFKGVR